MRFCSAPRATADCDGLFLSPSCIYLFRRVSGANLSRWTWPQRGPGANPCDRVASPVRPPLSLSSERAQSQASAEPPVQPGRLTGIVASFREVSLGDPGFGDDKAKEEQMEATVRFTLEGRRDETTTAEWIARLVAQVRREEGLLVGERGVGVGVSHSRSAHADVQEEA
jgi:hypothetical protein